MKMSNGGSSVKLVQGIASSEGESEEEVLRREVQRLRRELEELSASQSSSSSSSSRTNYLDENRGDRSHDDDHHVRRDDDGTIAANAKTVTATKARLPPEKSGYLFKWQDRSMGWGGTKWALRFVRLDQHGQLSYYKSHDDRSPRYVLTLKNCAVRDEGSKVNKRAAGGGAGRVLGAVIGSAPSKGASSAASSGSDNNDDEDEDDDDDVDPSKHEAGSRFYVFSVHLRRHKDDEEVVPLLRFSTQSHAEKMQWIDLISQACAYCDSDEYSQQQLLSSPQQQQQQPTATAAAAQHRGKRRERGTLPALVFESPPLPPPSYHDASGEYHHRGRLFRSKATKKDAARTNKISYPPSKPMHRMASPSYLSPEGGVEAQNYRGFFNLLLIILVVSNFRLLVDAVSRHGFILAKIATLKGFRDAPLADFPFVSGLLIVQAFVVGAYVIEWMLCRRWVGERFGLALHFVNTNASLGVVMAIVWYLIDHPVIGAVLILQATITWLKLISYVHANHDHRTTATSSSEKHGSDMLALVKDLDPGDASISYPRNVTLGDIYYFWFAPTLTYQLAFPRAPFVRWTKVTTLAAHLFVCATLAVFFAAQVIAPNLDLLVGDLEASRGRLRTHVIGDYLLKLSISSTYVWLLVFYGFFHCFLNLTAELLRFGDRGKLHRSV
jgi:diacylglycerol O-acyltransferase-1